MYRKIAECFSKPISGRILGISGIDNFYSLIDKQNSEITEGYYPEVDLQNLTYENNFFDYVISDQVLEHLENPQKAIDESFRVLKNDGIAIHTTCFINYIHNAPQDFWRFSPAGIAYLCRGFSKVLQCGGWGNRFAILLCFLGDRFRNIDIPSKRLSVLNTIANYNEQRYPIVTWIVAQK